MARKRIEEELNVKSWEDVDSALKEIAHHEIALEEIKGDMNKEINDIKDMASSKALIHKDEIKKLEKDIKSFVVAHKSEISGKTKVLNFGSTGFRKSSSVVIPRAKEKIEAIINSLKKNNMNDCIDVKESINKDILKKYSEDTIIRVGAKLKKQDTFWYEVSREDVK